MKRKITFLLAALLLMSGLTWAQSITWIAADQGYTNAQEISAVTFNNDVSGAFFKGTNNNAPKYYDTGAAIRCYGGNYFTVTSDYTITEITLGFGSGDGTNEITTEDNNYADGTWTGAANSVTFTIGGTSGHRRIATFSITYSAEAPVVATPSFSPAGGTYLEAQTVTISCETSGVDIYYTLDGTNPDDESIPYADPITVSETKTIKAIAYDNQDNTSAIATATYTILTPMTIAEVRAQATGVVVTEGVVTHISGITAYIQDETAAIVVYGSDTPSVGDEIRVEGTLTTYKGLLEIGSPTVTVLSQNNTVEPTVMTIEAINADAAGSNAYQAMLVSIEEATVNTVGSNNIIAQGTNTIVVYGSLGDAAVNDIITFTGNIGCFNTVQIVNPTDITIQQSEEPAILVEPLTVNVPSASAEGMLTVTYQNIEMELGTEIYWYEADGTTTATYDWVVADFNNEGNIDYIIDANTSEARTAYMKVYGIGTNGDGVFSELITFSQGHYIADYATLPFEFDGGRADIANTDGLTAEGLGSDYNNSPKLKFDSTGDWMILHFEETPGTLTFDIKGNTFSGGTFTVQTSEDGETYTDLATYTELGAIQHEAFGNLGANVRYIKWIYTVKDGGNVALGNIKLYEEGGGPALEASIIVAPATVSATAEETTGTLTVTYENISEIVAEVYYCDANGEAATYDWINAEINASNNVDYMIDANEGEARTAYLKVYALGDNAENVYSNLVTITQAAPVAPFEPATYTLATTIESGKTYIIVGVKELDGVNHYYAMGEQRNNNRAGVEISVDGTIATVETADVHEVVITALEENGFYSIYDGGYLYAASSSGNQLKTMDELDVNGQWSISIDTLFHVVADSSANRNVMQFNYNNNNPTIFSCYETASQSPVYLYVKDETPTTLTQTIALTEGWNWVSFDVEIAMADLQAALLEAYPSAGMNELVVKAKYVGGGGQTAYNPNAHRWIGSLTTLDLSLMYMVKVPAAGEITVEGIPVDPADHPLTIAPGANWIAFPLSEGMSIADAFAGFPSSGDIVKTKGGGQAQWNSNAGRWIGGLANVPLQPGQGYIYNSKATETRTYTYPSSAK